MKRCCRSVKLKVALLLVAVALVLSVNQVCPFVYAESLNTDSCKACVLISRRGKEILQEDNAHERLPIASVTKLMTILLVLEDLSNEGISLEDDVHVSENASGMGGSQVFLQANKEYKLGELLKSVIVASANDSSVALAEHVSGSEKNFVRRMNERASELNLVDTNYMNCTGLPSVEGYSSAFDQAIVLDKVLDYDVYHEYSKIWTEDFVHPDGTTTMMTNTNKLSRFYGGCIGGKTGFTNQAKYCLAVGAKRNDMELISVVLGADSTKERFSLSSELLNYGFDNFKSQTIFSNEDLKDKVISIKGRDEVAHLFATREFSVTIGKDKELNYNLNFNLPDQLKKVSKGEIVGNVEIVIDGIVEDEIEIMSSDDIKEASLLDYIKGIIN